MERGGWKPNVEIFPTCPRCGSSNTKFCYYNNYSLTQPRYFCKGCRRYWTKGGSLRNIPVGGGCRKTQRERKSLRISTTTTTHGVCSSRNFLMEDGNSSRMLPHGTNIDLAQVFANFLNQQPEKNEVDCRHEMEMHQLPGNHEMDPSLGFSNTPNMDTGQFGVYNECGNICDGSLGTYLSEGNEFEFCGFNSILSLNQEQEDLERERDYFGTSNSTIGLPPLPGEEMGWSESQTGFSDHVMNVVQPQGIEPGEVQDQNQWIGNKNAFDLSNYDTFFRP